MKFAFLDITYFDTKAVKNLEINKVLVSALMRA